jgi:predicted ribosome quality control (RQC) complex YloA/Tae2 family protein
LPRKEFTSFDIAVIIRELKKLVVNSRVNNVYQLDIKSLILKLHKTDEPPLRLVMEAGRRLHLSSYSQETPRVPPAFCMALRKYLRGAWISEIVQHEFERIVIIDFKTKIGMLKLVLELFGEGNIILTGERGEILQALFFKRMRDRNILRNEVFQLPPSAGQNPFGVTREELENALKSSGNTEVVRILARFLGVGGFYAEEILLRANIDKTKLCSELTNCDFDAIFKNLQSLLAGVSPANLEPQIVLDADGRFLDVVPFKLKRYENYDHQSFGNFNQAIDEFYTRVTAIEKAVAGVQVEKLNREADRLKRVIIEQEETLHENEIKVGRYKHVGDVIYRYSGVIQSILDNFATAKLTGKAMNTGFAELSKGKIRRADSEAVIESFDASNMVINVCIENSHFSLRIRKSLFENAAEYYERSKKAKQKSIGALIALDESRKKLAEIERNLSEVEALEKTKPAEAVERLSERRLKSKEWYEKFRWFTSSEGFLVVAGKDAVSNEVLIKKYVKPEDVVFHAEISGAPFVAVKAEGKTISEQTLREAGEFAVALSRAWRETAGSGDVYWVKPEQLRKSGPSGEYVPHGAFAVTGKRNWTRGVPLKLAIGVVVNDEADFIGGPVEAVKARTKTYLTLVPGYFTGKELLKRILHVLALKLPKAEREKVERASIEKIRELVPYTRATLVDPAS